MSVADRVGKTPVPIGGPAAAVAQLVVGFGQAIIGQNRKKQYKIDGQRVSKETFGGGGGNILQQAAAGATRIRAGQVATAAPIAPSAPIKQTDPGYRWERGEVPDVLETVKDPPRKQPPPLGPTDADRPRSGGGGRPGGKAITNAVKGFMRAWLGRAGIAVSAAASVAYLIDLWSRTFPGQPLPDGPPPRAGTGSQGGKGTQRPQLPPEVNVTINMPAYPQPPSGSSGEPRRRDDTLSPIDIKAKRIELPPLTPVKITARYVPVPKPVPGIYQQLLTKYGATAIPLLSGLIAKDNRKKKKKSAAPSPGLTPIIAPGVGSLPGTADEPLATFGNYFDSTPVQSSNCDCGPKKKRKPKKKRTTCYTGRFTERANGLRKYEKRKIKCR